MISAHMLGSMNDEPIHRQRSARDCVIRRIAEQIPRWPDLDVRPIAVADLEARDRRLAQAIYGQAIRRWITLAFLLDTRLARPLRELEPKMQAVLLVGAAQVFLFDHLPDHAVVDESVTWAKRNVRAKAGGMVNAVLRRMIDLRGEIVENRSRLDSKTHSLPLSDGRYVVLREAVWPDDPLERLAVRTSHPLELLRCWGRRLAPVEVERLALHNLMQAPTIIAGLPPEVIAERDDLTAHTEPGFAVWKGEAEQLPAFLAERPQARVQDPASHDVVQGIRRHAEIAGLIIDACAGSGTKTAQLAAAFPNASIIASDVDARRAGLLTERFAGSARVQVVEQQRLIEHAGTADVLLLDVPCTNTGTLARRVEAKYRVDEKHLNSLIALQKQIVADHLALRAPGGLVAYSTCSLEPEENEQQARWICKWHDLRIVAERGRRPAGLPGDNPSRYTDGGYLALIR